MDKKVIVALLIALAGLCSGAALDGNSSVLVKRLDEHHEEFGEVYPGAYYGLSDRVALMEYMSGKVYGINSVLQENIIPFLLMEPPIDNMVVKNILGTIILIIQPFYAFAIIVSALFLMLGSGSPASRKNAKSSLVRLVVGIGMIMLTIPIMQLILELSNNLSSLVLEFFNPDPGVFSEMVDFLFGYFMAFSLFEPILGLPFLTLAGMLPAMILGILSLRYFMVMIMTLLFPFAVLLYSFKPTNVIGGRVLNQILMWVFLPVMEAITLGVIPIAVYMSPTPEMGAFIVIAGSLLLIMTPLVMFGVMTFLLSIGIFSFIVGKPLSLLTSYLERAVGENG